MSLNRARSICRQARVAREPSGVAGVRDKTEWQVAALERPLRQRQDMQVFSLALLLSLLLRQR